MREFFITFQRYDPIISELLVMNIGQEATGTSGPENNFGNTKFSGCFQSKAHDTIGNYAGNRRNAIRRRIIELRKKLSKGFQTGFASGLTQGRNILCGIHVRLGKTIRNGFESERGKAIKSVGTTRLEETSMVVLCVDEAYVKTFVVEQFGQFKHWINVALSRVGYANDMRLLLIHGACGTHYVRERKGITYSTCLASSLCFGLEIYAWFYSRSGCPAIEKCHEAPPPRYRVKGNKL